MIITVASWTLYKPDVEMFLYDLISVSADAMKWILNYRQGLDCGSCHNLVTCSISLFALTSLGMLLGKKK